jgi:hypothetical protein
MKNEIDKDCYCSAGCYDNGRCEVAGVCLRCDNYHRKHPTPEQYKEEYGEEYRDDWAVYYQMPLTQMAIENKDYRWEVFSGKSWRRNIVIRRDPEKRWHIGAVVCACTPFGKPDNNWKPE